METPIKLSENLIIHDYFMCGVYGKPADFKLMEINCTFFGNHIQWNFTTNDIKNESSGHGEADEELFDSFEAQMEKHFDKIKELFEECLFNED